MSSEHETDETADQYDDADDAPRANQLVRRTFEGVATLMNNAATQALTAKATADINARWMIAMHRPRDIMDARQTMLTECSRPRFAAAAIYAVPRGGGTVRGLSIRFAEAVMKAMGNMGAEAQTLYDSDDERTVRVTITDYEGNTAWSRDLTIKKTKEVKQRPQRFISERFNSFGDPVWLVRATDDDVNTKEAAAISKASRTGILRMVPAWLLHECQAKCEATAKDKAAKDPEEERKKVFDAFAQLNVKPSYLAEWLGHPAEQATPAEIVDLQQLYRAIRDGHTTPGDALKERRGAPVDKPAGGVVAAVARSSKNKDQKQPQQSTSMDMTDDEKREAERNEREAANRATR